MPLEIWLGYVATVLVLMSTPGPSQILMLSNSMSNGFARSIATAAGDLTANILQMLAAGLGLAVLITSSEAVFLTVKWVGVAYLVYMGVTKLRMAKAKVGIAGTRPRKSLRKLWLDGFITSATNPKAVIFFASLFPLFINASQPAAPQLFILGATYIALDGLFLAFYGKSAEWIARKVSNSGYKLVERISASAMIGAAVLLGLKDVR